jgi:nitrite reductase/ring-hydroxylating ferredoxin subunit
MRADRVREVRIAAVDVPAPGGIAVVMIGSHRIGVMRVGDRVHALADRCPHRGAPLCSSGEIVTGIERSPDGGLALGPEGTLIRCPWHKWDFDIATGTCPADAHMRVRRYAVREDGGDVIVSLEHPE